MDKKQPEAQERKFWKRLCALNRFSFFYMGGGVARASDKSGNWIEVHSAQEIVDDAECEVSALTARITELESQLAQRFDAADMATAAAQGFRDGVASVTNSRPSLEEVFRSLSDRAYCNFIEQIGSDVCLGWKYKARHGMFGEAELKGHTLAGEMLGRHKAFDEAANALRGSDAPLTYPAPQEGMAWWQPIESAPKDGQAILVTDGRGCYCVEWNEEFDWWTVDDNKLGPFRLRGSAPTHWVPTPAAPGPADGESK